METPTYIRVAGVVYRKAVVLTTSDLVQNIYDTIDIALFGNGNEEGNSVQEIADYLAQSNDTERAAELSAIMQKYVDAQEELARFKRNLPVG